jgi:hypothetical protein
MAMKFKECTIVVASHAESVLRQLKPPYKEVCVSFGETQPFGYSEYISNDQSDLIYPAAWSEVAILLKIPQFASGSPIVGLQHYRRLFLLSMDNVEAVISLPFLKRNEFAESEISKFSIPYDQIVIPRKLQFVTSAWEQFIECKPELEEIFLYGLSEFDKLLLPLFGEVNSEDILRKLNYIHPFNMFVGCYEFYSEWCDILNRLVANIESEAPKFTESLTERWGGYLVERFFSVYVYLCQTHQRWNFIEKTVVIFDAPNQELHNHEFINERDQLIQQRDQLIQQRDQLIQQRDLIAESTIWKLTKFLRVLINFVKNLRSKKTSFVDRQLSIDCLKSNKVLYKQALKATHASNNLQTLEIALAMTKIAGIALEFGVYSGRTLSIISKRFPAKTFGFDSFDGLPEDWREGFPRGTFKIEKMPEVDNADIIPGLFQDTLDGFLVKNKEPISFVHLDADLYSSTKFVLTTLNERIVPNCVILFDEFMNYPEFEKHEYRAFIEWCTENSRICEPVCFTDNHEQMGFIVRK